MTRFAKYPLTPKKKKQFIRNNETVTEIIRKDDLVETNGTIISKKKNIIHFMKNTTICI